MKIIEQTNKNLNSIIMKAFSDSGTFQKPESMTAISQEMTNLKKEETKEEEIIRRKIKKSDITNILSNKKIKLDKPITKIFTTTKEQILEKWSKKYKDSIDCDNPKGFSQKNHCQGKKKNSNKIESKEATDSGAVGGGFSPSIGFKPSKFVSDSFKGTPSKGEFKEGASSASSGSYETPAAWAKSTNKKDWRGRSKTQIPGGAFVQVKKKCKTFPYCNQGDINALKITKPNKKIKSEQIIKELSKEHNIDEKLIKKLITLESRNKK
jgi:hypothetical protein